MAQYTDPNGSTLTAAASPGSGTVAAFILAAGLLALVGAGYFFMRISSDKSETTDLQAKTDAASTSLAELQASETKLASYAQLATGLNELYTNQRHWGTDLTSLQLYLYKNMVVTSLVVSEEGAITINGRVKTYDDYSKVYEAFTGTGMSSMIKNVKVGSVAKDDTAGGQVSFSFQGTLVPNSSVR